MDFLRRELAPVSPAGWTAIGALARETLSANLSGRRFLDVSGPCGVDYAALPLVEARVSFTLQKGELDNLERGEADRRQGRLFRISLRRPARLGARGTVADHRAQIRKKLGAPVRS